ncbi:MAG: hypothetical protein ABR968_14650 [Bacteroidales bacterium]|jgi:hypothetical protein
MGIIRMGPPQDVILYLKNLCKIDLFIETGTFHGWTSYWASQYFNAVKTIEFSKEIYTKTIEKHKALTSVDFIYGDSRVELKKIIFKNKTAAIFWLDAHYCSFGSYGEFDQCPLLEELKIILSSEQQHLILIDDARLFLSPPPLPNSIEYYPSISEIINVFNTRNYHTIIYEDSIICVPNEYKIDFVRYMQQKTTEDAILYSKQYKRNERVKKVKRFIKKLIGYKYWSNA